MHQELYKNISLGKGCLWNYRHFVEIKLKKKKSRNLIIFNINNVFLSLSLSLK